MTGPEHYEQAELLLETGCEYGCPHSGCEHVAGHHAEARVHASLAETAALVLSEAVKAGLMPLTAWDEWFAVTGALPSAPEARAS